MQEQPKTVQLKDIPQEVDTIIRNEQIRIELYEKKKLKKEHVVYKIIREWFHSKDVKFNIEGSSLRGIMKK